MKCKVAKKNSPFFRKVTMRKVAGLILGLLLAVEVSPLQAQMFSVGEGGLRYDRPLAEFYVGLEPMTTTYKGDAGLSGAGAFEFDEPVIRLGYNSQLFDIFLGTGGAITGIDEAAYFDVGGNLDFNLRIYNSEKVRVLLPLRVASRYTNITNNQTRIPTLNRFEFGSLTGGAGALIMVRPRQNFRFEAGALPSYGFSFASGGFFGGALGSVSAHGRLFFDRLFGDVGLSLGYDYNLRNYNIDEDVYDYKITGHSLEMGITF